MKLYHEELMLCRRIGAIGPITKDFVRNSNKSEYLCIVSHLTLQYTFLLPMQCKILHTFAQVCILSYPIFKFEKSVWIVHVYLLKMSLFKVYSILFVNICSHLVPLTNQCKPYCISSFRKSYQWFLSSNVPIVNFGYYFSLLIILEDMFYALNHH